MAAAPLRARIHLTICKGILQGRWAKLQHQTLIKGTHAILPDPAFALNEEYSGEFACREDVASII